MLPLFKNTLIIAEAGVNHNGDIKLAFDLVDAAIYSGADVVKFQTYTTSHLVKPLTPKAPYQISSSPKHSDQSEMLSSLELSFEDHSKLQSYCHSKNIQYLSTAFDMTSLDFIISQSPPLFKIPSGEITNYPYLAAIGRCSSTVILSTGMSSVGEVESAIHVLESHGTSHSRIILLHCTSDYPAPLDDVNLRAMANLGSTFGTKFGYSDHTTTTSVPIAAVALGASVIEKHITLSNDMVGPDHKSSLEPETFKQMVTGIRETERSLGSPIKSCTPSEKNNLIAVRKSLYASCDISAGETFTPNNVTALRPATGLSPMVWPTLIGTASRHSYKKGDPIL